MAKCLRCGAGNEWIAPIGREPSGPDGRALDAFLNSPEFDDIVERLCRRLGLNCDRRSWVPNDLRKIVRSVVRESLAGLRAGVFYDPSLLRRASELPDPVGWRGCR